MHRRWGRTTRSVGVAAIGVALAACAGCAAMSPPTLQDDVEASLAGRVQQAQNDLWPFRYDLSVDPGAALSRIDVIGDARPTFADPSLGVPGGSYTLLALESSNEGSALTLAVTAGASSGGGLFFQQSTSVVCFTLRFPAGERRLDTESADCTDGAGHGLDDIPGYWSYDSVVSLDDLDVRRTMTQDDVEQMPCQCASGSVCDCPGG